MLEVENAPASIFLLIWCLCRRKHLLHHLKVFVECWVVSKTLDRARQEQLLLFLHYDFRILPFVSRLKEILSVREQLCRRMLVLEKFLDSFNAILLKLNDQLLTLLTFLLLVLSSLNP